MAESNGPLLALGLMSGTSMDGIDAAIVRTDGEQVIATGPTLSRHYDEEFRGRLRSVLGGGGPLTEVARELTARHLQAVRDILAANGLQAGDVDVIGFHGHTVIHEPERRRTLQIGDGALLARETGISVVDDFRSRDVAAGGHGAPLAPLYHAALARSLDLPVAVLNIGGVANVSWIGSRSGGADIMAFDTGPGNALIDDWVRRHTGQAMDKDGSAAAAGEVSRDVLSALLDHDYFAAPPPKSLDRQDFGLEPLAGLGLEDGAATLTAFTAEAVARAMRFFPEPPKRWLVSGGGRRNPRIMAALGRVLGGAVAPVEEVGWDGDALEAQAFAYLAVRSLGGLAISLPTTTGVPRPLTGGAHHLP